MTESRILRWSVIAVGMVALAAIILLLAASRPAAPAAAAPSVPPMDRSVVPADEAALLASVPRISAAELHQRIAARSVVVIDVRDADSYLAGHIEGAMQIPLSRIAGEVPYLPRDRQIVTYCT